MQLWPDVITAYTVPSTYVSTFSKPTATPYRRVVGLVVPGFGELWSRADPTIPESIYSRDETTPEQIELPVNASPKLGRFYLRFFVEPPRVKVGNSPEDQRAESTNCHRFGYWMAGQPAAEGFETPEDPNHVVSMGKITHRLGAGVRGVLGIRNDSTGNGVSLHSVVGLGENNNECLQVLASNGFMGIDTYANIFSYYQLPPTSDRQVKMYH